MKRPNFFIVGAPKCGTTSLANWLRQHPQVFFSDPKEPFYFCPDITSSLWPTLDKYEQLFDGACERHRAVGEGSTSYLLSKIAVPRILAYEPEARFIVMLRSPLEMALSLHSELVFQLYEDITDFESAWRAQQQRRRGKRIPKHCRAPALLQYGNVCQLGEQLERLYREAQRDQVQVIFLEDMKTDPLRIWLKVTSFLEIEAQPLPDFAPSNLRKTFRSRSVSILLRLLPRLKRTIGLKGRTGLLRAAHRWNRRPAKKQEVSRSLRAEMVKYFEDDVLRLSRLTGRDLSHWLR